MDIPVIIAQARQEVGTSAARRLRKQGHVPAVIYGRGAENINLTLDSRSFERLLASHTFVLAVEYDGEPVNVQVKAIQYDHLGDRIIHADLTRISLTDMIHISVAIEVHGQPKGMEDGGVLDMLLHEVNVACLPMAVPSGLRVEVEHLGIGDSLTLGEIALPDGVSLVDDAETPVIVILAPARDEEEETAEEAADSLEPEVIGERPQQEDDDEG
jgi:large subunit ribosomal protein L25